MSSGHAAYHHSTTAMFGRGAADRQPSQLGGTEVPFASMIVVGDVQFSGQNASLNVVFDSTKNRRPSEGQRGLTR